MSTDKDRSYQQILSAVHRADLLSRRLADQQLGRQIGIGRAMFMILDHLADAETGPISQQAIADRLGLTKAAVSRHMVTGRENGWLRAESSSASRRENSVVLTPAGRRLVQRGHRHRDHAEDLAAERLGSRDLRRAAQTLERLCAFLEERLHD
jgi:DNA-binding MarR family transcriptional regulator